jgi:hypothetical protein
MECIYSVCSNCEGNGRLIEDWCAASHSETSYIILLSHGNHRYRDIIVRTADGYTNISDKNTTPSCYYNIGIRLSRIIFRSYSCFPRTTFWRGSKLPKCRVVVYLIKWNLLVSVIIFRISHACGTAYSRTCHIIIWLYVYAILQCDFDNDLTRVLL